MTEEGTTQNKSSHGFKKKTEREENHHHKANATTAQAYFRMRPSKEKRNSKLSPRKFLPGEHSAGLYRSPFPIRQGEAERQRAPPTTRALNCIAHGTWQTPARRHPRMHARARARPRAHPLLRLVSRVIPSRLPARSAPCHARDRDLHKFPHPVRDASIPHDN